MTQVYSCEALIKRGDSQFAKSSNFFNLCQAIAEVFYPERADFVSQGVEGVERYQNIFAGEPILLRQRLGSGVGVLMRRSDQKWFNGTALPRAVGEIDSVKRWCEEFTEVQRDEVYAPLAMFDRAMREGDDDYVSFGEHILWHGWGKNGERGRLLFQTKHLRDCAYFENEFGVVDEMHEKIGDKTIEQWKRLMDKVGGTLPEAWQKKLRENPAACATDRVEVRRVVLPAERYYESGKIKGKAKDMAFACIYIAGAEKHEMHCDGFRIFPFLVRRWSSVSGEVRGRSPCTGVAMADSRILNVAQRALLESLEKAIDPPILIPHDGVIGDVEIFAGGRIMYDVERGPKASDMIDTLRPGDVRVGLEFTERRRMFLAEALYANLLKRLPDKEMTAFEASQWLDDYVTMAAPVLNPMQADNAVLMEAVFQRLLHAGRFPEPPEEVLGAEVTFEFETPVAQAMRRQKAQKAAEVVQFVGGMAVISPQAAAQVAENIDLDKLGRDGVEGIAGGIDWLLPDAVVAENREAAQQEQMAKAAAAMVLQQQELEAGTKKSGELEGAAQTLGAPTAKTAPQELLNAGA